MTDRPWFPIEGNYIWQVGTYREICRIHRSLPPQIPFVMSNFREPSYIFLVCYAYILLVDLCCLNPKTVFLVENVVYIHYYTFLNNTSNGQVSHLQIQHLGVYLPVSRRSSSSICSDCSISVLFRLYQTSEFERIEFINKDSLKMLATSNWYAKNTYQGLSWSAWHFLFLYLILIR